MQRDDLSTGGYFPYRFHTDFIDHIADFPEIYQVITYRDLKWQPDDSPAKGYPAEKAAWDHAMRSGELDSRKIYVLIQHDVDSQSQRSMRLARYEALRNVPSNIMIFNRRVDRKYLTSSGKVEYTPYDIDFELLRRIHAKGFVIGYHMNAYEQSNYQLERAREVFLNDIQQLKEKLPIEFFSAHGGSPGPNQINNRDIDLTEIEQNLIWVHNGITPKFDGNYSDGGINSIKRDPLERDLRDFVKTWQPGKRYRVLTHPQYYHDPVGRSPRLSGARWYEEVLATYSEGNHSSAWENIKPALNGSQCGKTPFRTKIKNCLKNYLSR